MKWSLSLYSVKYYLSECLCHLNVFKSGRKILLCCVWGEEGVTQTNCVHLKRERERDLNH